jgi:hypothetical protein
MRKLGFGPMLALAVGGLSVMGSSVSIADPLGGKEAWDFTPQNRAALAIAIKNIEDPGSGGSGGGTTIVCGGNSGASGQGSTGSGSTATGNDGCVIINGSNGSIVNTNQASDGNQDADATANSKSSSAKSGSIDDVAAILGGNKQGL